MVLNSKDWPNNAPTISVAMPVYNGEQYLAEALDSILTQTFRDFEFIIIDDGSTDKSLQLLREYQKRDSRIRLIARENRNLATTLNDIVDIARGKWIARMDQDDVALPVRFERQLEWLSKTDADICGSWVQLFGARDKRILKHPQTDEAIKMEMLFSTPLAHPTVMMATQLVKQLRYDKVWERCEDYDLWERASRAGWKMTNLPEVLLLYRQHNTQISSVTATQQQLLSQKIRRRYWEFVANSIELKTSYIDEVLKITEPNFRIPNMNDVDLAMYELLKRSQGEARETILFHVARLYYRVASDCPNVVARWSNLNKKFGVDFGIRIKIKLWLLRKFSIHPNSKLFKILKKLYFNIF